MGRLRAAAGVLLRLSGVTKEFPTANGPVRALDGVDLEVRHGEYVLVQGASGAGKTTLLNVAGLLENPSSGSVSFEGRDAVAVEAAERARLRLTGIGFVFQHYYLVPDLTVLENVSLPALAAGARPERAREAAERLLARVGLEGHEQRIPRELSGGEQQRVGIARSLVNRPRLLLADEPTGNLDAGSAAAVAELLADAHRDGVSILLVTHEPLHFPSATRRALLHGGRIIDAARP